MDDYGNGEFHGDGVSALYRSYNSIKYLIICERIKKKRTIFTTEIPIVDNSKLDLYCKVRSVELVNYRHNKDQLEEKRNKFLLQTDICNRLQISKDNNDIETVLCKVKTNRRQRICKRFKRCVCKKNSGLRFAKPCHQIQFYPKLKVIRKKLDSVSLIVHSKLKPTEFNHFDLLVVLEFSRKNINLEE